MWVRDDNRAISSPSQRLAAEAKYQREARLRRSSANQGGRLAIDMEVQRENGLRRSSTNKSERLGTVRDLVTD